MNLRIRSLEGLKKELKIASSSTGHELRKKVCNLFGIKNTLPGILFKQRQLLDNETLDRQNVSDGETLILLARDKNRSSQERLLKKRLDQEAQDEMIIASVIRTLKETSRRRTDVRLRKLQTRQSGFSPLELESLEAISQNLTTIEQLFEHRQMKLEYPLFPFKSIGRKFKLGQWVDVKDTIDQWLEAEIIDISDNQAYVHYNGWGARWDEWIDFNSPRISWFRTKTVQPGATPYLSPVPAQNLSGTALKLAPPKHSLNDVIDRMLPILKETLNISNNVSKVDANVSHSSDSERDAISKRSGKIWERKPRSKKEALSVRVRPSSDFRRPKLVSPRSSKSIAPSFETIGINFNEREDKGKIIIEENLSGESDDPEKREESVITDELARIQLEATSKNEKEVKENQAAFALQLAPLLDRMGRALIDLAPHFAQYGNEEEDESGQENSHGAHLNINPLGVFNRFSPQEGESPSIYHSSKLQTKNPNGFETPVILTPGEVLHASNLAHPIRHDCCIDIGLNVVVRSSNWRERNPTCEFVPEP